MQQNKKCLFWHSQEVLLCLITGIHIGEVTCVDKIFANN